MVRKKKASKNSEPQAASRLNTALSAKTAKHAWFMEMSGPAARDEAAGLIGSVMDVTGLKPSSDHYALQQDRYRAVLQEMEKAYYETDLQGKPDIRQ